MKITVVGAGNMGGALARGWAKSVEVGAENITVSDLNQDTLKKIKEEFPGITVMTDNAAAVRGADIVVCAVKPWLVEPVVKGIKDSIDYDRQVVVSIAAGVMSDKLIGFFQRVDGKVPPLFYVIPNIAAEFCQSMSFVSAAPGVDQSTKEKVRDLFAAVGDSLLVEERLVNPGMMMASCGIAHVMRYIRAMQEGGVEMGFYPAEALKIAMQTMLGAVNLLKSTGLHPEAAIDKVTTPGGTTIKGLNQLDHSGFNSAVIKALKAGL